MTALTLGAIALGALLGLVGGVAAMRRDRRRAHQVAAEREATLRALFAASPEIIAILAQDGRVRALSPAARRVLGVQPGAGWRSRRTCARSGTAGVPSAGAPSWSPAT
jgi:PAS domain-containing protein